MGVRDGLAEPGAEKKERDDAGALQGPERVAVEVLPDEAEMVQVEAEVEGRHPDDGDGAQRVEAVVSGRGRRGGCRVGKAHHGTIAQGRSGPGLAGRRT